MVVARIVGCDGWLIDCFFPLSNTWICVVGGVEMGSFVSIYGWGGWSVEWWWVEFCQFIGGCLDLLGCEIWWLWAKKSHWGRGVHRSDWGDFLTQLTMVGQKIFNPTHHISPTQPTWVGLGWVEPMDWTIFLLLLL